MKGSYSLNENYIELLKCISKKNEAKSCCSGRKRTHHLWSINPRFNNDLHFQEFSCLNAVFKAVGPALVKEGKVSRKSGETGEPAHKQGPGIFPVHTPETFLHYCADTDVLQRGCGRRKKKKTSHFHKNSSCSTDRCTAGDACECRPEKWMIS